MTKKRFRTGFLISLLPVGLLCFISFIGFVVAGSGPESVDYFTGWENFWGMMAFGTMVYWWAALVAWFVLRTMINVAAKRMYTETRRYADQYGWRQISETAWTVFKPGGLTLRASQDYNLESFHLNIEANGLTEVTSGFSRSLYALQFGDFLWERALSAQRQLNAQVVRETRAEWTDSMTLMPGR